MYEFKRSLNALLGILTLVGIAIVAWPHNGRGASGTNNSAPTAQTQNVNVVNTPTVAVANFPATTNVGITGTPTVAVTNFPATMNVGIDGLANTVKLDTTNPIPVRDVDNPAGQPFKAFNSLALPFGQTFGSLNFAPVPAGKVLVIEGVSVLGLLGGGDKLLYVSIQTGNATYYLHVNDQGTDDLGRGVFVVSDQVRFRLTEGEMAQFYVERNPATSQSGLNFSIFGYFVDAR